MKIGVVVDGDAESQALRNLTRRIQIPGVTIVDPIFADMQPTATPERIVAAARERIEALVQSRQVDKILVLIDLEDRSDVPHEWARTLTTMFHNAGYPRVSVIVKNRKFENWLIADLEALRRQRARYRLTKGFEQAVSPDKADNIFDAEELINTVVVGPKYHKRRDAGKITALQDCLAVAKNSRSFRVFLHLSDHPAYSKQSRRPAA